MKTAESEKKERKQINIAQKAIITIAFVMLIVNGVTMNIIKSVTERTMIATEEKYLNEIVKNISNTAEKTVMEYVTNCEILAKNLDVIALLHASDEENSMVDHPLKEPVVTEMENIITTFDERLMSMAIFDLEEDAYMLNTGVVSGEDFSFRERPYFEVMYTQEPMITAPYLDVLTNGLVVTIAVPVIDQGVSLGVVGMDLPIDFMESMVEESSYGDSGRSLVLAEDNTILAYADSSYINFSYSALNLVGAELERELENPTGQLVQYEMNGDQRLGLVVTVDTLGWKVLTAMDYSDFDTISAVIMYLMGCSLVFTLVLSTYFISGKFAEAMFELHHQDSLTGLYNRVGFTSVIGDTMKSPPETMGILSININGLKQINENAGISMGDNHIKSCADRLQQHFNYRFFRMSGDELLGIASDVEQEVFEEEVNQLHEAMHTGDNYDFSLGHAWGKGNYDLWKLMQEADTVMYINKQEYYASSNRKFDQVDDGILADLLSYLADDEFIVYLQPQVHLKDGSLYGAEALIRRFDKKNKKMVFPDQFIPQYEQKSIIRHVDLFVVKEVCKLLSQWNQQGKAVPISVNLSRVTLLEYGIVNSIAKICDEYQVPHKFLVIEVTERVGLIENNVASSLIQDFKALDFHISLDDFGCAYSNIVTLALIQVDEVKIDKSLVDHVTSNQKNHILVKNVLSMCNELEGTSTLAEGIEEEEQAKLLFELGCHLGQGYHFSRPIPVDEFQEKYMQ